MDEFGFSPPIRRCSRCCSIPATCRCRGWSSASCDATSANLIVEPVPTLAGEGLIRAADPRHFGTAELRNPISMSKQINFTIVPDDPEDQDSGRRQYANFCAVAHTPFDMTL